MHVRELVEVAALVAWNGPLIIRRGEAPAAAHLEQYWAASKCRCEDWHRRLKQHTPWGAEQSSGQLDDRVELRAALDEIFVGEMLTRVWSAVLVGRARRAGPSADDPVARSVLVSHLEARHRALSLLLDSQSLGMREALSINRMRRRAERWTDVLIGGLLGECDVREFAVDAERAVDFALDLDRRRRRGGGRQAWRLTLVSLRNAFQAGLHPKSANPEANARITASILGSIGDELFDSTGLLQSPWMMRLSAVASDAQGLIDDLLGPESWLEPAGRGIATRRPR